jgi:hypothetical protein
MIVTVIWLAVNFCLSGADVPYERLGTRSSGWLTLFAGAVSARYAGKDYSGPNFPDLFHQHKNETVLIDNPSMPLKGSHGQAITP